MKNDPFTYEEMSPVKILIEKRNSIAECYDKLAAKRDKWIRRNKYYYNFTKKVLKHIVEPESRVLQIKCETGYYLNAVNPKFGMGIDFSSKMIEIAKKKYSHLNFGVRDLEDFSLSQSCSKPFDYILLNNCLGDVIDISKLFSNLKGHTKSRTRLVIMTYNRLWQPLLSLASFLRLKIKQPTQNWLSKNDLENLLYLSGYEIVKKIDIILFPKYFPIISFLLNNVIARLPLFKCLCLNNVFVVKKIKEQHNYSDYSVSIIIPCKNEKGNIKSAVDRIPKMGKHTEIIFCDDKSDDGTLEEVNHHIALNPDKDIKIVPGPGICKAKNVWAGFEVAKGDILMILDADLTVIPEELPYFFNAIVEGKGEFINGCRLVYPMNEKAMKFFNVLGNKFFSILFSFIMEQKIKDTLCGTKVLWREDYLRIKKYIGKWGYEDLWGDYDLLFGATKINLKVVDLPVHYFDRTYGDTKMTRVINNGFRMLRISINALFKLRFY